MKLLLFYLAKWPKHCQQYVWNVIYLVHFCGFSLQHCTHATVRGHLLTTGQSNTLEPAVILLIGGFIIKSSSCSAASVLAFLPPSPPLPPSILLIRIASGEDLQSCWFCLLCSLWRDSSINALISYIVSYNASWLKCINLLCWMTIIIL